MACSLGPSQVLAVISRRHLSKPVLAPKDVKNWNIAYSLYYKNTPSDYF